MDNGIGKQRKIEREKALGDEWQNYSEIREIIARFRYGEKKHNCYSSLEQIMHELRNNLPNAKRFVKRMNETCIKTIVMNRSHTFSVLKP